MSVSLQPEVSLRSVVSLRSAVLPHLSVTARGRRILRLIRTLLIATVIITGVWLIVGQTVSADAAGVDGEIGLSTVSVVVGEGESLWTVAAEAGIERDTRDVVADIVELNGLTSPVVHPGQTLEVPQR